jgi:hypothetical protein
MSTGEGLEDEAAEIVRRAERRLGEMLAGMDKHPGGRPAQKPLQNGKGLRAKLRELDIKYADSHRWQREATVPKACPAVPPHATYARFSCVPCPAWSKASTRPLDAIPTPSPWAR